MLGCVPIPGGVRRLYQWSSSGWRRELALKGCIIFYLRDKQVAISSSCVPVLTGCCSFWVYSLGQVEAALQNRIGFTHLGSANAEMLPGCRTCSSLQQWKQLKIPISCGAFHSLKGISVILGF